MDVAQDRQDNAYKMVWHPGTGTFFLATEAVIFDLGDLPDELLDVIGDGGDPTDDFLKYSTPLV